MRNAGAPRFIRPWSKAGEAAPIVHRALGNTVELHGDGNAKFDGNSGAMSSVLGAHNARVSASITDQLNVLASYDASTFSNPNAERLARSLIERTGSWGGAAYLANSGSEANEAAIGMATQIQEARGRAHVPIAVLSHGYHGSTSLLRYLSMGGQFAPKALGLDVEVRYIDCAPWMYTVDDHMTYARAFRRSVADAISGRSHGGEPAGIVIIEPWLNVAGGYTLPLGTLSTAEESCRDQGAILIADEVFTGFGRRGALSSALVDGIDPDFITLSKGLTNGTVPLSATLTSHPIADELARLPRVFAGHTMSGNALAAEAAIASLAEFDDNGVWSRVRRAAQVVADASQAFTDQGVRHHTFGSCVSVHLNTDADAVTLSRFCSDEGVIVRRQSNSVMLIPALTSADSDLLAAIGVIAAGAAEIAGSRAVFADERR
ncbi:aminotransferase class III-fold pyridoxal phosphate-dependent enzyme [Nocardia sp. bgisy134]|uniref:aminotransferase class III-fold pyridoxal phosphate-dependent enzyme n=1 Tax=Nocardia sp. bgisy134 TaxID=3413789 RepID=UPI003D7168D5